MGRPRPMLLEDLNPAHTLETRNFERKSLGTDTPNKARASSITTPIGADDGIITCKVKTSSATSPIGHEQNMSANDHEQTG